MQELAIWEVEVFEQTDSTIGDVTFYAVTTSPAKPPTNLETLFESARNRDSVFHAVQSIKLLAVLPCSWMDGCGFKPEEKLKEWLKAAQYGYPKIETLSGPM